MSMIEPYLRAPEKLRPSRLTAQLEVLSDEIDVDRLNLLATDANVALQIRSSITAATVTRTIQGASTLVVTLEDPELALTRSGVFGSAVNLSQNQGQLLRIGVNFQQPLDVELDGLYFRLVSWEKPATTRSLTLTFEDREVNVIRTYPKQSFPTEQVAPHTFRIFYGMDRIQVMQWLVAEAAEFVGPDGRLVGPRLVSPLAAPAQAVNPTDKLDPTKRLVTHAPGFPILGPATVTVKHHTADPTQLANISAVLDVGYALGAPGVVLIAAVMTLTQESDAKTTATNGTHVGLFQQDQSAGSTWVQAGGATRDAHLDAHAFLVRAIADYNANSSQPLASLAAQVQGYPHPGDYAQWETEAAHTVAVWLGTDETIPAPLGNTGPVGPIGPVGGDTTPTIAPGASGLQGSALFKRGMQSNEAGRTVITREDNWAMLQRLAQEVGWLCYCVSGTVYVEDYAHLTRQAVRFQASEDDPGIDGIGAAIDTGMANVTATVQCRISRWGAPPGTIVKILDLGPASGKWIVQTIQRDLFTTTGTITLQKPQGSLPEESAESPSPVQSIQLLTQSGTTTSIAAEIVTADSIRGRNAIVAAALKALANRQNYPYSEILALRDAPNSLFDPPPVHCDCSSFVTLCYKAAHVPDPNGYGYHPLGDTASLIAHGTKTQTPQPGDLLFYNWDARPFTNGGKPDHVVLWVGDGNGTVISESSPSVGLHSYTVTAADLLSNQVVGIYTYNLGPLG